MSTGKATPEQIEAWKQQVKEKQGSTGQVYEYNVGDKYAYLRSVDRDTYNRALAKVAASPGKFNEIIIQDIWLGGDDEIRKVECYYFGLADFIEDMLNKKKGSLTIL